MKYQKKPVIIDAVQFDGTDESLVKMYTDMNFSVAELTYSLGLNGIIVIPTLEGNHIANVGDWIIKGIMGEFYPCKDTIFKLTYEMVEGGDVK